MKSKSVKWDYPHRLYILMRNDLASMNAGKAMAQAAHASNLFTKKFGKDELVAKWEGDRGFGTTIVLACSGEDVNKRVRKALEKKLLAGHVFDPSYPFVVNKELMTVIDSALLTEESVYKDNGQVVLFRHELTCGFIFLVEDSSDQIELVGDLPLHP